MGCNNSTGGICSPSKKGNDNVQVINPSVSHSTQSSCLNPLQALHAQSDSKPLTMGEAKPN